MKKAFISIIAIGMLFMAVGAMAQERFSMLKFMVERQNLKYTRVPHKVLAFYYSWYGTRDFHKRWIHWEKVDAEKKDIANSTNYPEIGAYDSYDTSVVDYHFGMAKACGIDGMIATWWGMKTYEDRAMPLLLERAKLRGIELSVYFEAVRGNDPKAKIDNTVQDLSYIMDNYASHPAFLKVGGKPVIFIYGRAMGQAGLSEWSQIIASLNKKYASGIALIADGFGGDLAKVFDGMHIYNSVGLAAGKTVAEIDTVTKAVFGGWVDLCRKESRICCVDIIPGYDDTKIRKPGLNAERHDGEVYRTMWKNAIVADPDWVLITTWNEWHEGSEIEPSAEYGNKYIKITAEFAPVFKQRPFAIIRPSSMKQPRPAILYGAAKKMMQNKFRGVKVGLMPDMQSRIIDWVAKSGLDFSELEWQDLLDAKKFSAKELPVIIFAGGEGYAQSLKTENDMDSAILGYLKEGGILVVASSQPFPFYYNEKGDVVMSSVKKFGLPVCGSGASDRKDYIEGNVRGWEQPPKGIPMSFRMNKAVFKQAVTDIPFPQEGDQRWRPVINKTLGKSDVYLGIAQLYDSENIWFGDGIAYIEHKETEPKGAKLVYIWSRMLDTGDPDMMLYELFDFLAGNITK